MNCNQNCNQGKLCDCRTGEDLTAIERLVFWLAVVLAMYIGLSFLMWSAV